MAADISSVRMPAITKGSFDPPITGAGRRSQAYSESALRWSSSYRKAANRKRTRTTGDPSIMPPSPNHDASPQTNRRLLTRQQAAEFLNVSDSFLRELARTHRLPAVRFGRKAVRFDLSDLERLLHDSKN
jgi:excisionase family DNA binding protein